MPEERTYLNGQQTAWIQALREGMADVKGRLVRIEAKTDNVVSKVNHIYGVAAALGGLAGAVMTAIGFVVVYLRQN